MVPELQEATAALAPITKGDMVAIVAEVPSEWGLAKDEANGLVEYLVRRKYELLVEANSLS